MELVRPDHPIAHEAYETVKAMTCEYIKIVARTYSKTQTEAGYFISGIFPCTPDDGFNRKEWISTFEELQGVNK
ncbi:hypothetical protein [Acinetobacter baumannii]|uniref:Uncharacterized protein n=1 Tax=Acinetobacter baumannii TaxID=470 RepID=A0A0D5YEZ7_ACIBA|nr:hypothetical protein [Acinetobacter baumannii]AKA30311.1 hypothetical protein ABUW_0540 [Acinetobacter baumannii]ARG33073.1 hypothetical protein B7L41_18120 [Acinetobacter baumannii]ASF78690.1 hypothetical protein CBI29_03344 [Acinetobacter baumannii]AVN15760.1 hypothetical protein C6N18_17215 [Acinetobacter baumannii]AXB15987.1 hypothetical protein DPV67_11300 [Acinetobacter baumannii]